MARLSELKKAIEDFMNEYGDKEIDSLGVISNNGVHEHTIFLKDDSDEELIIAIPKRTK